VSNIKGVKMHKLNVQEKYYNMLKKATKTIELRLFDDKRKNIKTGDVIEFSNNSDDKDTFLAQVVKLHRADSFEALCHKIDCHHAGFDTNQELVRVLEEFYSLERQKEFGVVGIEVKKID
jgi:ASC-1-like (ASCH) protein